MVNFGVAAGVPLPPSPMPAAEHVLASIFRRFRPDLPVGASEVFVIVMVVVMVGYLASLVVCFVMRVISRCAMICTRFAR